MLLARICVVIVLVVSATCSLFLPTGAQAESCEFILGFKALRDLIPGEVGACVDNVSYNPANGDALQHTTGGLLVWRKADNWTAFTNGYETWINGPLGLQKRLNTERFCWEADYAGDPVACSALCASQPGGCSPGLTNGRVMTYAITLGEGGWVRVFTIPY